MEAGESFKRLGEVKYSLEENVRQNFLDPLGHLQNKDLKEVNVRHSLLTLCMLGNFLKIDNIVVCLL